MKKNFKKIKENNEKLKKSYYDYYNDIKDYTKGFKEDW